MSCNDCNNCNYGLMFLDNKECWQSICTYGISSSLGREKCLQGLYWYPLEKRLVLERYLKEVWGYY